MWSHSRYKRSHEPRRNAAAWAGGGDAGGDAAIHIRIYIYSETQRAPSLALGTGHLQGSEPWQEVSLGCPRSCSVRITGCPSKCHRREPNGSEVKTEQLKKPKKLLKPSQSGLALPLAIWFSAPSISVIVTPVPPSWALTWI